MIAHPVRSILFVPAHRADLAAKAAAGAADVVCLDLEDGIAQERRPGARAGLAATAAPLLERTKPFWVRINGELELAARDLDAIPPGCRAVVLAKTRDPTHAALVAEVLDRDARFADTALVALVETPAAVLAFEGRSDRAFHPRLVALALGAEDLAAELGAEPDAGVVAALFDRVLGTAAALGLDALGYAGTIAEYADLDRFSSPLDRARASGAIGGFCIHPRQIEPLHAAFTVSVERIRWAREVVDAFEKGLADGPGGGARAVDGAMVDRPIYLRARAILERTITHS